MDKNAVNGRRGPNKGISSKGVDMKNDNEYNNEKPKDDSIEKSRKNADMIIIKDKKSGEEDKESDENSGASGDNNSLNKDSQDNSGDSEFEDKKNEPPDVLKIINDLRDKTMAKVKGYINEDISPLSVEIAAEDNIALREKLMKYGLYVDVLEADNEKDRELIEKINTYDREEVKDFFY